MKMTYRAYYYLKQSGRAPLADYIASLKDKKSALEIVSAIDTLVNEKCQLPSPFVKHVWKKVYELRIEHKRNQYRVFYFIYFKGKIVLLDGYTKKTRKIPKNILKKIQNYYFDYLSHLYEEEYEKEEISEGS